MANRRIGRGHRRRLCHFSQRRVRGRLHPVERPIGRLDQLHQHPETSRWLEEGYFPVCPRPRRRVNQLHALVLEIAQVPPDVRRAKAQMVQPRPAALQKPRHRRVRIGRLQQLDQHVGRLHEGYFELAVRQVNAIDQAQPKLVAVEVHGVVNTRHRDADVVDRQCRLVHSRQYLRFSLFAAARAALIAIDDPRASTRPRRPGRRPPRLRPAPDAGTGGRSR